MSQPTEPRDNTREPTLRDVLNEIQQLRRLVAEHLNREHERRHPRPFPRGRDHGT